MEAAPPASLSGAAAAQTWTQLLDYYPSWLAYRRWFLRVPGVQFAVRVNGTLAASGASGVSDVGAGTPLTSDHLFRIASHSKTFAAVLVLQLVEQGSMRLDDELGEHLPVLRGSPLAGRTIRELLAHAGGVVRDSEDGDFWQLSRPFPDRDELVDIARDPAAAVLGRNERFKYSNIGYGLLGLVIDAVTGSTFAERLRDHVSVPLGLRNLGGEFDPSRSADYAAGHSGLATARHRSVIEHVDTRALAAATGCFATAEDLTAFFSALLPGRDALLSDDGQRLLRHRQWEIKPGEQGYGLGVFLDKVGGTDVFGHTGGYPGHTSCSFADPGDGWAVSVLTNAIDGGASELASGFFRLLDVGRTAEHANADDRSVRFTGRFASTWGLLDVVRLDGRLFSVRPTDADPAEGAAALEVVDDSTLRIVGGRGGNSYGEFMRYEFDGGGAVTRVRAESGMSMRPYGGAQE